MADVTERIRETLRLMKDPPSGADLARRTGIPESTMRAYINGTRKPPLDVCLLLGPALGVDGNWLYGIEPSAMIRDSKIGFRPPPQFFGQRDMPVYAATEGGPGEMVISSDPIDFVVRPWYLGEVRDGFAVIVVGDSMSPAYEPGDLAVVNPALPPMRNKTAIFTTDDNGEIRSTIKRLINFSSSEWFVEQYNPHKQFVLDRHLWSKFLRVVGKMEA